MPIDFSTIRYGALLLVRDGGRGQAKAKFLEQTPSGKIKVRKFDRFRACWRKTTSRVAKHNVLRVDIPLGATPRPPDEELCKHWMCPRCHGQMVINTQMRPVIRKEGYICLECGNFHSADNGPPDVDPSFEEQYERD